MSEKTIEQRAIELVSDPTIHDPEALKHLLAANAAKGLDMMAQLLVRDSVIRQCRELADSHKGMCGITDMIGKMLSELPPVEVITGQVQTAPEQVGPPMLLRVQTAQKVDGWYARALVNGTDEIVGEAVGPYRTRDLAVNALRTALAKSGKIIEPDDPGLDDGTPIRVMMGQQPVHQA